MAPAASKANYKSYEAQARMVRAIVAAHPDVRWNYKEIAVCYGSDMTEHALNHRFRRLRAQAFVVHAGRAEGLDMKDMLAPDDLPNTKEGVDKTNIAKYFGQSTPDGIQFQFRAIKHDADRLRAVEAEGGDVATCLSAAAATPASTPSKPRAARAVPATPRSASARKRSRLPPIKRSSSDDEEDDDDDVAAGGNWSEHDHHRTPSKRARTSTTPRRAAAKKAAALRDGSQSPVVSGAAPAPAPAPRRLTTSLFGPVSDPYIDPAALDRAWDCAVDMDDGFGDGEI